MADPVKQDQSKKEGNMPLTVLKWALVIIVITVIVLCLLYISNKVGKAAHVTDNMKKVYKFNAPTGANSYVALRIPSGFYPTRIAVLSVNGRSVTGTISLDQVRTYNSDIQFKPLSTWQAGQAIELAIDLQSVSASSVINMPNVEQTIEA